VPKADAVAAAATASDVTEIKFKQEAETGLQSGRNHKKTTDHKMPVATGGLGIRL